ncbi:response regulator transcription factor [Rhodococcoides kyotonense]|uniref:LuxR family transcriptional regulator n=1 Tax=Rhodococcoides kyotonense TaxID=398843 RepID=A0A177Y7M2_9NOCA|nr:LuxR C-terminal-related transcriptional regulator [Rhodococcus kyotonensis]OAK51504.1 LuxR family transcriptional regulator [Rhodococcus kyotonensis]
MSASFEAAVVRPSSAVGPVVELSTRRTMSLVPPPVQLPPSTPATGPFLPRPILTDREVQVLTGWIRCDSKTAVAKSLFLSLGTINTHLTRIRAKYAAVGRPASTKAALVARALQDGLIDIADL